MFIKFKMFGYLKKRKVFKDTSLEIHTPASQAGTENRTC